MACSQAETVGMELGGLESRKEALGSWLEEVEEDAGMTPGSLSGGNIIHRDGDIQRGGNLEEELVPGKGESPHRYVYIVH